MKRPFCRLLSCYLILALFVLGSVPEALAGMAPSEALLAVRNGRAADLETVQKALEIKLVRQRLEQMGFSQEEVLQRIQTLDDSQLHELATKIDEVRVGGDGLGIIIALLVIAILVVVLVMLLGKRIIVTD
jgi:hypothetical protein